MTDQIIVDDLTMEGYTNRLKNQIFKILPLHEEGGEWEKHVDTLLIELYGLQDVLMSINFLPLIGKLNSLRFLNYKHLRKTVFEMINLVDDLR